MGNLQKIMKSCFPPELQDLDGFDDFFEPIKQSIQSVAITLVSALEERLEA